MKMPVWMITPMLRYGWWKLRREQGHAITFYRAFFGKFPRFGSYEADEVGCPAYTKADYEIVSKTKAISK
jgi:hypothetical protein